MSDWTPCPGFVMEGCGDDPANMVGIVIHAVDCVGYGLLETMGTMWFGKHYLVWMAEGAI